MLADSQANEHRALVAQRFAWVIFCICLLSILIRPLFSPLGVWFTLLGAVNALVAFAVYRMIVSRRFDPHATVMVLGAASFTVLPVLAVSGGVNSQFTPLIALFTFVAWLLDGRRAAIKVALFWGVCVVVALAVALLSANLMTDSLDEVVPARKTLARGIWLLLGLLLTTYFACQFDRSYSSLQEQLLRQASEDPLTGLANRRVLDERLERALQRAQRQQAWLSLLVIDADNFKQLNDRWGHVIGDACLVRLAQVLSRNTRQGQDLVARFGGEEFVVLLESTDAAGAAAAAEHIRAAVADLVIETNQAADIRLTVTIGVATTYGGNLDRGVDQLMQAADAAMYQGKENGRNRVEFGSTLHAEPSTS